MNKAFTCCRHAGLDSASSRSMKGFTLIELLVVVLIIGILAAVAVPQYQKAVIKSKIISYIPVVKAVIAAQQSYYLEKGEYANSFDKLDVSLPSSCLKVDNRYVNMLACERSIQLDIALEDAKPIGQIYLKYCPNVAQRYADCEHSIVYLVFKMSTGKMTACRFYGVTYGTEICNSLQV